MRHFEFKIDPVSGEEYYDVQVRGQALLADPHLNKGTCFSREERVSLDLLGLLPNGVSDMETQVQRCLEAYRRKPDDMERYIYLIELLNRNETLFYRLLTQNLDDMVPIIYTPTVGTACQQMSHIQRRVRGIYIHPDNIEHIDQILSSVASPDIRLIVVTDGERILGLGDLGADGMGIPVGKVALYIAAGGLHPATCLPMCLDVGTNNEHLLKDPLYMGYRRPRLTGQAYDDFIEKFVCGVQRNFPHALLQWEDFAKHNAFRLLERYRNRLRSFNDDIQGTGAVTLAALLAATKVRKCRMRDLRYLIVGMGEAGRGIADDIRAVMEDEGASLDEIKKQIFTMGSRGLLVEGDPAATEQQREYATRRGVVVEWRLSDPNRIGLLDVIRNARPNVVIGVTAQARMFDESVLKAIRAQDELPVILPLSNPTSRSECTPAEAAKATGGRFLMATGSPFAPVDRPDGSKQLISQCNNMYVFPGVGLGAIVAGAQKVTDRMFVAASRALAEMVSPELLARGALLPEMKDVREASFRVAVAVAKEARAAGLGRMMPDEELARVVRRAQWKPEFRPYRPAHSQGAPRGRW